jgi:MFS transporter, PAT family, beta-lactamase induction signal transducer AmpG
LLFSSTLCFYLADAVSWQFAYWAMAASTAVGIVTTFLAPEPLIDSPLPRTLRESVLDPLLEYFRRPHAWLILAFMFFYKVGEALASEMYIPFYMKAGFSNAEIGTGVRFIGMSTMIAGSLVGGLIMVRFAIYRSLWIFGVLQSVALLSFAWLATLPKSFPMLAAALTVENFTSGMATAAFLAFIAMQSNKRFSGTQLALFNSLVSLPGVFFAGFMGILANAVGWPGFFICCMLMTIPGLVLLIPLRKLLA